MANKIRRIGIMTGGGDCPGLNAVIRSVGKAAINGGIDVVGIYDGYLGLIENRMKPLTMMDLGGILTRGGTILGSCNKADPKAYAVREGDQWITRDVRQQVVDHFHRHALDAMIVIGGDGTMCGAADLIEMGLNIIGVPKTIDNDLWGTEITFGHDTAVTTAADALDKLHTTASSHHRVMVLELMGRYAGWLTLNAGVASGADVILIPEIPFDIDKVAEVCTNRHHDGRGFTIIAVGEGAKPQGGEMIVDKVVEDSPDPIRLGGVGKYVAEEIEKRTGLDGRAMVLGHIQRGGTPTALDRILATNLGYHAFELLMAGEFNRLVVRQKGEIKSVEISEIAGKVRTVPEGHITIKAARGVGTSFGD
jgi:phosphofructokinase-like protein